MVDQVDLIAKHFSNDAEVCLNGQIHAEMEAEYFYYSMVKYFK